MRKVVGLVTDGATVMASVLNGVIGLIAHDNDVVSKECVCGTFLIEQKSGCTWLESMNGQTEDEEVLYFQ